MSETETELERRIRERAYHLWLAEGCPEGRAAAHWDLARRLELELEREAYLDEEGEESFPASDPPSHVPITGEGRG
jgi:Protein of unknown function (DUF2934)